MRRVGLLVLLTSCGPQVEDSIEPLDVVEPCRIWCETTHPCYPTHDSMDECERSCIDSPAWERPCGDRLIPYIECVDGMTCEEYEADVLGDHMADCWVERRIFEWDCRPDPGYP